MTEALLANHYIRIGGYLGPIANGQYTGYYTSPVNITRPVSNPNYPGGGVVVAGIYPASITNSSTINGSPGPGIYMGPGTVANTKTGVIIGGYGNIGVEGAESCTVTNAGTITASGDLGTGIDLKSGGAVINLAGGSITAPAIGIAGGGTITNAGSISSANDGIELLAGGQITNAGSPAFIGGAVYGVVIFGGAGNVSNSGTVTSTSTGIDLEQGGTVTNMAGWTIIGG